ncbi:hypothetical protein EVAR_7838_1 [Eumeta japonica]|uniref:Uncharacterized protein n=1 Tax=Eumeta variegata TaxID=151549 RepID=A0A4C1TUZ6_EUMVA|nr:hypothetical protein EVAR_7838_1 [Eumeta japonica]
MCVMFVITPVSDFGGKKYTFPELRDQTVGPRARVKGARSFIWRRRVRRAGAARLISHLFPETDNAPNTGRARPRRTHNARAHRGPPFHRGAPRRVRSRRSEELRHRARAARRRPRPRPRPPPPPAHGADSPGAAAAVTPRENVNVRARPPASGRERARTSGRARPPAAGYIKPDRECRDVWYSEQMRLHLHVEIGTRPAARRRRLGGVALLILDTRVFTATMSKDEQTNKQIYSGIAYYKKKNSSLAIANPLLRNFARTKSIQNFRTNTGVVCADDGRRSSRYESERNPAIGRSPSPSCRGGSPSRAARRKLTSREYRRVCRPLEKVYVPVEVGARARRDRLFIISSRSFYRRSRWCLYYSSRARRGRGADATFPPAGRICASLRAPHPIPAARDLITAAAAAGGKNKEAARRRRPGLREIYGARAARGAGAGRGRLSPNLRPTLAAPRLLGNAVLRLHEPNIDYPLPGLLIGVRTLP